MILAAKRCHAVASRSALLICPAYFKCVQYCSSLEDGRSEGISSNSRPQADSSLSWWSGSKGIHSKARHSH